MITALTDKVIVQVDEASKVSPGGIYLVGAENEKPETGTVLTIGPEVGTKSIIGKRIVFNPLDGEQFSLQDKDYFVFSESSILAVLD